MKIAICDDEEIENLNLTKLIYDYADENKFDIEVFAFTSGSELLKQNKFDLYFLDFLMPEMNGTELALSLKNRFNDSVTICYLTSYERAAVEVINNNINAVGFLTKPAQKMQLAMIFDKLQKNLFFNNIVFKKDQTAYIFHPQDIIYVEAMRKNIAVHTFEGEEEFRLSFSELAENYLPEKLFAKVHRSFIVNLSLVKNYNKKEIIMTNGDSIPISRTTDFDAIIDDYNMLNFSK